VRLPFSVIVALAALGGLFLGLLAAVGMAQVRRRQRTGTQAAPVPVPDETPAFSPNGGS
jgi:hypothetical protein